MGLLRKIGIIVAICAWILSGDIISWIQLAFSTSETPSVNTIKSGLGYTDMLTDSKNFINNGLMSGNEILDGEDFVDDSGDGTFRLLTFNTWGLKYVSKFRKERLMAIADKLAEENVDIHERDYDIIALQEVWTTEDWNYIDDVCSKKYPYRRWFSSGIISGPGLAILSKYPIKKTQLYRFPVNGRPSAFYRGDWYVGKSVSISILELDNKKTLAVLNSHMHAPYSIVGDAAYEAHRACQAWDIATIVGNLKEAGHAVILVGDLNSRPGSIQYRILEHEAGLTDSWELLYGKTDLQTVKEMDPNEQIMKAATTCDSTLNTWRADRRPDEACRLDYALVDSSHLQTIRAGVRFVEQIPGIGSYSDHFAYSATFKLNSEVGINGCQNLESVMAVYGDLKMILQEYMETTLQWQRRWRFWHFALSVLVAIAFLPVITVVSYRAPWASILFYLFGCIIFASGIIDGLISYLFGRYEFRNMNEVILEVNDRIRYLHESA